MGDLLEGERAGFGRSDCPSLLLDLNLLPFGQPRKKNHMLVTHRSSG